MKTHAYGLKKAQEMRERCSSHERRWALDGSGHLAQAGCVSPEAQVFTVAEMRAVLLATTDQTSFFEQLRHAAENTKGLRLSPLDVCGLYRETLTEDEEDVFCDAWSDRVRARTRTKSNLGIVLSLVALSISVATLFARWVLGS